MTRALAAGLLILVAGCTKDAPAPAPAGLVPQVKQALAEREKRLTAYHLVVDSTQGDEQAHHEFFFRAPNHSRGVATGGGQSIAIAFDGQALYRLDDAQKALEVYQVKLPPQQAALTLASLFRPFAPDGFRTPLIPSKGVTAVEVAHPQGPRAVEVTVTARDEAGPVEVTYVLRHPSGDFLGKRTRAGGHLGEVKVLAEHCDAALKLCVPTRLEETRDGAEVGATTVTTVELNPELPLDGFRVAAPDGYQVRQQVMQ